MKVKLLRDIRENVQINSLGKVTNAGTLKVSVRGGKAYELVKGSIHEFSDASAQKYIEAGAAEATEEALTAGKPAPANAGKATLSAA